MRKSIRIYITCLLLCCSSMWGCKQTTVISREDQIALLSQDTTDKTESTTADLTDTAAPDSWATEESTDDSGSDEESDAVQSGTDSNPASVSTKPLKPDDTVPPETTKSSDFTEPVNTASTENITISMESEETTHPAETMASTTPEAAFILEADPYDISCHTVGATEYAIHAAVNAERTAAGVPELTLDKTLCAIASVRAYEASQYWSHNRPDGSSCFTVLSDYGYAYTTTAENLAQAGIGTDAGTYVYLWDNSEGYRDNMLNPEFIRAGIGVYDCNGITYVASLYIG